MSVRSVTLTVAGQTLNIRTDATDDELAEVTRAVDGRVQDIRASGRAPGTTKVHLLAAVSLADDLRRARAEIDALRAAVGAHATEALRLLDDDATSPR